MGHQRGRPPGKSLCADSRRQKTAHRRTRAVEALCRRDRPSAGGLTMTRRQIGRRFRALFGRAEVERELQDEMQVHLDLETEDLMRTRGLSREDARREAALRFGG